LKPRRISAADLFCGAGGTSTGLGYACEALGLELDLLAVNHWDVAIATHSANHPDARHLCENLDSVDPRKLYPGGRLNLLCASPECTHHSVARGGRPINDQSRASAWHIVRWAEALYINNLLIENVPEFLTWGPIGADGHPLKSRRGQTFAAFVAALRSLDYAVEWRVLNCADYGDPTTRERLFIQARRGGRRVTWPEPTHARPSGDQAEMFGARPRWRAAREIIDWSVPGESIFTRRKPLAPATIARIAAGLRKFGGAKAEPFILLLNRLKDQPRAVSQPMATVTATSADFALVEPFVLGQQSGSAPRSTDAPLPTVATDGAIALVEPFLVTLRQHDQPRGLDEPIPTVSAGGTHHGLVEPFILSMEHGTPKCDPFVIPTNHGKRDTRTYRVDAPMPTVTTVDAWGVVQPFLVSYYGTENVRSVSEPTPTVTTKDRFGLVEAGGVRLDIRFRMLQPHELAAAQGFPRDYQFSGNRENRVKQIGNAVPVNTARALCAEILRNEA